MGEKNKKRNEGEEKKELGDNKKKDNNVTVVLKADLHCEGCASKVIKCIRSFDGVDTVTTGDGQKITVVGKVDPAKLREKVAQKTHKKVELISPQPKKDGGENNNKESAKGKENSGGGDNRKKDQKNEAKDNSNDKSDQKKPNKEKEPPVTTAVFKVPLHCEGCIQKIYKTVTKTKGYDDMKIDKQKDLVTVTGAIDMKALAELLQKQLKKDVQIVPPKKDAEKKDKNGGAGDKGKDGGGGGGDEKLEGNKVQAYPYPFMPGPVVIGDQIHYNPFPVNQYHAPQIFSDENPNACSVM